jgi:protein TonB
MKGHKTSGDWSDVTSYGRNEIVFEGRHKEYGAYAVRQRYTGALLLGLLVSVSTGIVCAGVPFIINLIGKHKTLDATGPKVDAKPRDITIIYDTKPKQKEQIKPKTDQPKTSQTKSNNVVIAPKPHDTATTAKKQNENNIGTETVKIGKPDPGLIVTKPNIGTGTTSTEVFKVAQIMPKFKEGDIYKYVAAQLQYPQLEIDSHIEGTAYVSFIIETDGSVSNVQVVKGVAGGPGLDKEAARVISAMPAWIPGSQNGHLVRVQYTMPIKFQLR